MHWSPTFARAKLSSRGGDHKGVSVRHCAVATLSGNVGVSGSSQDDEGESDEDGKMLQDGSARVVGGERVGRGTRVARPEDATGPQSVINGILSAYGFLEIIQLVDYLRSNGFRVT
ncbi:hypothetical protein THAOC_37887, partial [Thalassiosira oceanica]